MCVSCAISCGEEVGDYCAASNLPHPAHRLCGCIAGCRRSALEQLLGAIAQAELGQSALGSMPKRLQQQEAEMASEVRELSLRLAVLRFALQEWQGLIAMMRGAFAAHDRQS
jgi:hypothetical protein